MRIDQTNQNMSASNSNNGEFYSMQNHALTNPPHKGRTSRRAGFLRIISYVIAGWIIAPAVSQAQMMTQTGQALDANPMVGTGGSNTPIQGYVPLNQNLYAPSYGSSVNGSVSVPSTTYQIIPVTVPGVGTTYARIPAVNQSSFYNQVPQSALPLYQVRAVSNGTSINSYNNAINGQINPQGMGIGGGTNFGNGTPYSAGGTNYVLPYDYFGSNSPTVSGGSSLATPLPGFPVYNNGQSSNVGQVSPLFGLRQVQVQQTSPNSINGQILSGQSGDNTNNPGTGTYLYSNSAQVNGKVNGQSNNLTAQTNNGPQGIGQPIVGMVGAPKTKQSVPSGDLYQQLIHELATGEKISNTGPGLQGKPAIIQTTLNPQEEQNQDVLQIDPITGLPIAPLTAQRQVGSTPQNYNPGASSNSTPNNASNNNTGGNTNMNTGENTSGTGQQTGVSLPPGLSNQLQSGQNVQPLNTLVGPAPGDFNGFMKSAQNNERKGLFLYAIQDYQAAQSLDSNNMLPIVGQANAELGGGFYTSAINDFKNIFTSHPELTAVRYNLRAMLPDNSIDAITMDLLPMTEQKSGIAAFLLSYVYYQTDQTQKLQNMLNTWAKWNAADPWPGILHKAWLEKSTSDSTSGAGSGAANP